jgi:hypothetical protein
VDSVPWGHEAQVSQVLVSRGGLGFGTTALKRNFFRRLVRGLSSFLEAGMSAFDPKRTYSSDPHDGGWNLN